VQSSLLNILEWIDPRQLSGRRAGVESALPVLVFIRENESRKAIRAARDLDKEIAALEAKLATLPPAAVAATNKEIQDLRQLKFDLPPANLKIPRWWSQRQPAEYPDVKPEVVRFFQIYAEDNQITPEDTPVEELLKGPSTFQRKGAASDGLQAIQQRLKAVQP